MAVAGSARRTAHRARRTDSMHVLARVGLAAHGTIWFLLGVLAAVMAFSGRKQETDQKGALEELAGNPGGFALVLVIAVGLAAYALWKLAELVTESDTSDRVSAGVRAVIYGGLSASAFQILIEGHTSSTRKQEQSWSSTVMAHTGGRWLVGIVGVVVIGLGGVLAYRGVARKFEEGLGRHPRAVTVLGLIGSIARGIVVGLAGVLALVAAIAYDPKKASGIDGALRTLRDAPAGPFVLVLVALGLLMFGVFGWCEAKYRRV